MNKHFDEERSKDEELQSLRERLAKSEDELAKEKARVQRLQAESLYMQTAISKYVPPTSYLHPSATACSSGRTHTSNHASVALEEGEDTVTVSREAFELLQLKDRAMDSIKEGITIADCSLPDMPLIYANQGFVQITGCPVADVLGKNCRFLQGVGTEEDSVRTLGEAAALGKAAQVTLTNYRRNGDAFVNYLSITPVHNNHGQLTHYVGVQSDITELVKHKKAELAAKHQAVQAEAATEAKSQFLARMSHEIRTPLNGMIAVGQLLAETNLTANQRDLVNTIRCSGETLLILITDILDFSRIEANKMVLSLHHFKLRTVLESAMEIAGLSAAQKRVQVAYHIAEAVPESLLGDAQRLQQVLLNVLNNAVKFTEKGQVLCEVWMGGTGPSLLQDTGYPLQALEGALQGHAVANTLNKSIDNAGIHDGPNPCQSPFGNRTETTQILISHDEGNESSKRKDPIALEEAVHQPQAHLDDQHEVRDGESLEEGTEHSKAQHDPGQTACGRPLLINPGNPRMTHTIHFAVRDTGIGISQDNLGRLFKLFSQVDSSRTRQHGGSGLGLAICKKLVEAMGGSMWGTSPGKKQGSTFHFSIRCPVKTDAESDSCTTISSSSLDHKLSGDVEKAAQSRDDREDAGSSGDLQMRANTENGSALGQGHQSTESAKSFLDDGQHMQQQTPFLEAAHSQEWPDSKRRPSSPGQPPTKSPLKQKSKKKENIRELRQVLTDILPGGSESPSTSTRTSTDRSKNSGDLSRKTVNATDGISERGRAADDGNQQTLTPEPADRLQNGGNGVGSAPHEEDDGRNRESFDKCPSPRDVLSSSGLGGKRVLLVEQNSVVRHCMLLYLKQLGVRIKAVPSEDQAISALRLQGALTRKASSEQLSITEASSETGSLSLEHARPVCEVEESIHGPFDVVVTDINHQRVLHALIQAAPLEAQRLVFMSWPGERDLDKNLELPDPSTVMDPRSLFSPQQAAAPPLAQPPKAFREDMRHRTTTRQLGYVTIFKPIRQERLKLAIEEVLRTTLNPSSATSSHLLEVRSSSQLTSVGSDMESSRQPSSNHEMRRSANSSSSGSLQSNMAIPRNLRVLLAEDNIINLKVALGILQRIGFKEVVCAADGVNALSEMTVRGGGDAFDIVLTDLHMPRKGGMELVREIRETWPCSSVKVVAVTADAFDDTRDLCLAAGFDAWLAKPFRIQDLARVIDLVVNLRSPFKSPADQLI